MGEKLFHGAREGRLSANKKGVKTANGEGKTNVFRSRWRQLIKSSCTASFKKRPYPLCKYTNIRKDINYESNNHNGKRKNHDT